jgi:hypothetical protein
MTPSVRAQCQHVKNSYEAVTWGGGTTAWGCLSFATAWLLSLRWTNFSIDVEAQTVRSQSRMTNLRNSKHRKAGKEDYERSNYRKRQA